MQSECCFPMSATNRQVSESSSFPILKESRFVVGDIEKWCDGVEQGSREPSRCDEALLSCMSCPPWHWDNSV